MTAGDLSSIDRVAFAKALVAALRLRGVASIDVGDAADRKGMDRAVAALDAALGGRAASGLDSRLALLRIANGLRRSPTGGLEGWSEALREISLTFTSPPMLLDPGWKLDVSLPTAQDHLDRCQPDLRRIAEACADAYLAARATEDA